MFCHKHRNLQVSKLPLTHNLESKHNTSKEVLEFKCLNCEDNSPQTWHCQLVWKSPSQSPYPHKAGLLAPDLRAHTWA